MIEKFFEGIEKCESIEVEGILADERVNSYVDLAATIMTMEDNLYELGFDYFVFCLM